MSVINLVTKYLPILDEQYKVEAKSSILDTPPEFVQMTKDAKKVKLAKMTVDGLANYNRAEGFTAGNAELTWEEHEFRQDRGRAIQIDVMDDVETFGLAFGRLAGEFQRTQVIPEIDAYRFAEYYQHAGIKKNFTVEAGAIIALIDDFDAEMDEQEVPEDGRLLFVNPQVYKLMINDPAFEKYMSVEEIVDERGVSKKFYAYNGHRIIKVPSNRFYTKITLNDGKTSGQEGGGYAKASDGDVIGMLMIHPSATMQLSKRRIARIWAPSKELAAGADGVNPGADAWRFDFRVYHDAWELENKTKGIAGATVTVAEA